MMQKTIEIGEKEIPMNRSDIIKKIEDLTDKISACFSPSDFRYLEFVMKSGGRETMPGKFKCVKDIYVTKNRINDTDSICLNKDSDAEATRGVVYLLLNDHNKSVIRIVYALFATLEELNEQLVQNDQQPTDMSEPLNDHSCQRDNLV
jgi:sulfur transfer protein SufE